MRVGVLGTGTVGRAIAGKLAEIGHEVVMGTRDPAASAARTEPGRYGSESFADWHRRTGAVRLATFEEAAAHGELLVLATSGMGVMAALEAAGAPNLNGKVLIDITNAIDPAPGFPPSLFVANTDSLAERIQAAYLDAKVVKSLNTVTAAVMVDPQSIGEGEHVAFVAGNDAVAKATVTTLLRDGFGWKHVLDLGDITSARAMEMYLALWLRAMTALETPMFNVAIVR